MVFNATDRRRYEGELLAARNALAKANKELRAFYDTLPFGIFRAETSGKIVQVNHRFYTLLGIEAADDWHTAIASEDHAATEQHLREAFRDGKPLSRGFRVADLDATFSNIEMKAVPISRRSANRTFSFPCSSPS